MAQDVPRKPDDFKAIFINDDGLRGLFVADFVAVDEVNVGDGGAGVGKISGGGTFVILIILALLLADGSSGAPAAAAYVLGFDRRHNGSGLGRHIWRR